MKNSKYGLTSFLFAAFSLSTLIITGFAASAKAQEASVVEASVNTQKTLHQIDRRVYSHFLEHIYNSCNGGLWGELVWNRSLEAGKAPSWSFDDGVLKQSSMANDCRFILGADLQKDAPWTDYDVRVNVHKQKGDTIEWELMDVDFPSDPVLPQGIKQLLGGFDIEEYALSDKNKLMVSYDLGLTWTQDIPDTHEDIDEVPTKDVALVTYPMNMADRTMYVLMAGTCNGSISVWRKIVDLDWGAPESSWSYMDRAGEEEFDLPVLSNLSLVYYDKSILAFGGDYKTIYQSRDNGITWKTNKAYVMPKDFDYQVESVKAAVDEEDYIWLYCKLINGDKQVWRGRLNRLGWFYQ